VVLRLKTRSQFQAVLAGERVASTTHFVLHRNVLPDMCQPVAKSRHSPNGSGRIADTVWLGAMVPKRWAKRAVTRNAIKRQIYSVSSEVDFDLPGSAHVVRLRAAFDRKYFRSASSDPLKALVRQELVQLFGLVKSRRAMSTPTVETHA
jgi:ribonuclease P protein component